MKKIFLLLIVMLCIVGCGKEGKESVLKDFTNKINNASSYVLEGSMEISNDEETFTYSLESYYKKDNYYKVILVNQTNNHEQIILKNNNDIYVITPSLNKSFKFQSDWPNNSSQAYLLGNIVNDIKNDTKAEISERDNGYIIKSGVNYPNNEELKYQKIYLDNNKNVERVEVFNDSDIVKIKVVFSKIKLNENINKDEFNLNNYVKEEEKIDNKKENEQSNNTNNENIDNNKDICEENTNNEECQNNNELNEEDKKTANIENIIYPLYIPSNTFLSSSEKIDTEFGNRVILTFSGEKNFVLIEEVSIKKDEMEIVPVYGEPLLLTESIGALSANSLSWDANNISYYLASTELSVNEMQSIANSLGNEILVNKEK